MFRLKSYLSVFLLLVLLFPLVESSIHELGHLDEVHCAVKEKHFCAEEHHCDICDYIFSGSSGLPGKNEQLNLTAKRYAPVLRPVIGEVQIISIYVYSLRGPPSC